MTFHCYFLRRGYRVGSHDVFYATYESVKIM